MNILIDDFKQMKIREEVINILEELIDVFDDTCYECDLIESEILDSSSIIHLIVEIERRFSIEVDIEDMEPESFNNVNAISEFIIKKMDIN